MIYRDNTAYDFDLFTDKKQNESKVIEIPDRAPAKKTAKGHASARRNAKTKSAAAPALRRRLAIAAAVAAVLLLVVAQLHCQLQNSETVAKISETKAHIETLQSEQTRLQVELNGKISFTNMEKAAKELGMQKVTVAQTQYVNLCTRDASELLTENNGFLAQLRNLF